MKVKTSISNYGEWEVIVFTKTSQYKGLGQFYTICYIKNYRGETIRLSSHYTKTTFEAGTIHLLLANKAKEFFDLNKNINKD